MRDWALKITALFIVFLITGAFTLLPLRIEMSGYDSATRYHHDNDDMPEDGSIPREELIRYIFALMVVSGLFIFGLLTRSLFHWKTSAKCWPASLFLAFTLLFTLVHFFWIRAAERDAVLFCIQFTQALKILALGAFLHFLLIPPATPDFLKRWKLLALLLYTPGIFIAGASPGAYIKDVQSPGIMDALYAAGPLHVVYPACHWFFLCAGVLLILFKYMNTVGDARNRAVFSGLALLFPLLAVLIINVKFSELMEYGVLTDLICMCGFSFFFAYSAAPGPRFDFRLLLSPFASRKHRFLRDMADLTEKMGENRDCLQFANALSDLFGRDVAIHIGGKAAASTGGGRAFRAAAPPADAGEGPPAGHLIFTADLGPEFNDLKEAGVGGFVHIPLGSTVRGVIKIGPGVEKTVYSSQDMAGLESLWAAAALWLRDIREREIENENRRRIRQVEEARALASENLKKSNAEFAAYKKRADAAKAGKKREIDALVKNHAARMEAVEEKRRRVVAEMKSGFEQELGKMEDALDEINKRGAEMAAVVKELKDEKMRLEDEQRGQKITFSPPAAATFASAAGDGGKYKLLYVGMKFRKAVDDPSVEASPAKSLEAARALIETGGFDAMIVDGEMIPDATPAPLNFGKPVIVAAADKEKRKIAGKIFPGSIIQFILPSYFRRWEIVRETLLEMLPVEMATLFRHGEERIISVDPNVREIAATLPEIVNEVRCLLFTGSTGVGKELFANLAFASRPDCEKARMITVNCTAITSSLFESEVFGHEKGAFSGATRQKKGYIDMADNGALFFDEIGDLPLESQSKLLRVVETQEHIRVGAAIPEPHNVQYYFASNKNLKNKMRFKEDLYHRISQFGILIPDLKERVSEDIDLLIEFFRMKHNARHGKCCRISRTMANQLKSLPLTGNARELSNRIEKAIIFAKGDELLTGITPSEARGDQIMSLNDERDELTKRRIEEALRLYNGNKRKAAEYLGLKPTTLGGIIKRMKILEPPTGPD